MNTYKTTLISDMTCEFLGEMVFKRPYLSSKDFKMLVTEMTMYAAEGYYNNNLSMLIHKNDAPVMLLYSKTKVDGSTIAADFYIDGRYLYTKMIAC